MTESSDVIVIGAGAAGITAAIQLAKAGLTVRILEARGRLGGRMLTVHDPGTQTPIELGAEFIHGKPPEILNILQEHKVRVKPVAGDFLRVAHGEIESTDFFSEVDRLMEQMNDGGPDEPFGEFLQRCCQGNNQQKIREWARGYVTGFHAADPELISVHSLVKGMHAEEEIGGHQSFRMEGGYGTLLRIWEKQLLKSGVRVQLDTRVKSVYWKKGSIEIEAASTDAMPRFTASKAVITLPLSLLQAKTESEGAVRFSPEIPSKRGALEKLVMGKVIRVTLCFRERFWDNLHINGNDGQGGEKKILENLGFLFSGENWFPTWWTTLPNKLPIITGWAPFHCAERLASQSEEFVRQRATETLARILRIEKKVIDDLLSSAHYHNWEEDPFSRGAYSYVKAGGDAAQEELAAAVEDTLFFAGEATDFTGHHGTVHGAMRSGIRAAGEILDKNGC